MHPEINSLSHLFGKICSVNSRKSYVFNWNKIAEEDKDEFLMMFEGSSFEDEVEDEELIPFAIVLEFSEAVDDLENENPTLTDILENQEGGELPDVLLYEADSGKVIICEEGDKLSEFCSSLSDLNIT